MRAWEYEAKAHPTESLAREIPNKDRGKTLTWILGKTLKHP
jgi:hypothetical protein